MQNVAGSPDFVVMFLPNESFLAMALEKEPSLMEEALSKKVLITTPGTLVGLLKVIRYGWNEQKIAINAQNIADAGAKLNTEISRFLDDFAKVGLALQAATEAFDNSKRRVEKQIANTSANLTALGAKSKKELDKKSAKFLNLGEAEGEGSEREEIAGGAVVEHGEDLAALPFGDGDGAED
jgi:DNA recombination protein RmuC